MKGPDYWTTRSVGFPESCCVKPDKKCGYSKDPNVVFQSGCQEKMKEFLLGIGIFLGALAISVGIVEV